MENNENTNLPAVQFDEKTIYAFLDSMGLAKSLNDNEKKQFLYIAQAFKLDPFKREIHVSKYGDNFSVIIGYEQYIKRAERSKLLKGWSIRTEGEVHPDYKKSTLKAIITINRSDRDFPFEWEVDYTEYVQTTKVYDNNKYVGDRPNKFWATKPKHMIKKVCIAQGFRLGFSDELGGMPYTDEELTVPYEEVHEEKKPIGITETQKDQLNAKGDANLAVNDDITEDQKKKLFELLDSKWFTEEQRTAGKANIVTYSSVRAEAMIKNLEATIKKNEDLQKTVDAQKENQQPPADQKN